MIHNHNIKILAFVGLAGSGKTTAAEYMTNKGYPKVSFDNIISETMKNRGIEDTAENEKLFRDDLRATRNNDSVVNIISSQIHNLINAGQHRIIVDGLYSWTEYKTLKHEFSGELTVVAVVAPKRVRHRRLTTRPIRPLSQYEADQRDWSDIGDLEKGGPIAIADHFIINDDNTDKLYNQIDMILGEIEFIV
jgi:dephospho-CoA kinase